MDWPTAAVVLGVAGTVGSLIGRAMFSQVKKSDGGTKTDTFKIMSQNNCSQHEKDIAVLKAEMVMLKEALDKQLSEISKKMDKFDYSMSALHRRIDTVLMHDQQRERASE